MNDTENIPPKTLTINTNKRALAEGSVHLKDTKVRKIYNVAVPEWLRVEQNVFHCPTLFGNNVSKALHWDDMSFDQFMNAGLITTYPEARQFRIEKSKATPVQQFGFDGAVLRSGSWSGVQVKHHRRPVSPDDLGSFLLASNYIKAATPHFHSFLVSTSGFTERVSSGSTVSNYDCISVSAADILNITPPAHIVQQQTDIDCMTSLRPCQQEALDAMMKSFENEYGYFVLGLPPGAGKTLVCEIFCLQPAAQKYSTIIIASPLRLQVAQTKNRFDALLKHCGIDFTSTLVDIDGDTSVGNICADRIEGSVHYIHTTFRSADKVALAMSEAGDDVLVFVDEAHRYTEQQLGCVLELTQDVVLVSGTWHSIPADLQCNIHEDSMYTMTITDAEKAGIIVPQRFVIPAFENMEIDVNAVGCEVQAEFIATATMRLDNGPRRHILYSATVSDAKFMATLTVKEFERSGMHAEARVLTGKTAAKERHSILKWVGEGSRKEIRIISSVHVLDEGIDIPPIDCVFISSIGSSDCRYVQRVCRSVRLYPGKTHATVLVWSSCANMRDLSEVFRERSDWQSSVICMGVSLEASNQQMEKAGVSNAVSEIEKGLVGYREWSWDKQFAAWSQAADKRSVTYKQVEVIDGASYKAGRSTSQQNETQ
jgi:superfamily II DNA or RNA helicase